MARTSARNALVWIIILALAGISIWELDAGKGAAGSEKLAARARVSAQQGILARLVNAVKGAEVAAASDGSQLSPNDAKAKDAASAGASEGKAGAGADAGMGAMLDPFGQLPEQVENSAQRSDPGSELPAAAMLARLGQQDRAEALLDRLDGEITAGNVTADERFRAVFDAVEFAVGATRAPGPGMLSDAQATLIVDSLGEPGRTLVAQARGDAAELDRMSNGAMGAVLLLTLVGVGAVGLALAGFVVLVLFLVLAALGKTHGVGRSSGHLGPVYGEVFAVWMGCFILLQRGPGVVLDFLQARGMPEPGSVTRLLVAIAASVAAAWIACWWGTRRGLTWRTLRAGVGLARFHATDVLWGAACWSMGVLFLAVGLGIAFLISRAMGQDGIQASHPIQGILESSTPMTVLLTYVVASVCAPVFEELFFRGALYRNVRDAFGPGAAIVGVAVASLSTSVLFAAIHPQGFIFIPVLGGLALAFCIMREWRGSINACIVAHAINNFVVVTLNLVLLGVIG
jgi:membrane protease YdiL (CAAX protease family)